ncbi:MAG TPA: HlyD family secretion protein [Opitutus sp.]|nr:HlyD family secretion protein [Opitutus sp.]
MNSITLSPTTPAARPVAPVAAAPRHHSRMSAILLPAFTIAVAAGAAWYAWPAAGRETTDSAFIDGHRVALAAQVPGRVSAVLVDDNQHVTAGQVLLRIDPADFDAKLEQALAARDQAVDGRAHARAQLAVTEAIARQSHAQVAIAEANARKTADDFGRYRELSADALPRIALDASKTQAAIGAAQAEAAHEAAAAADAQIALAKTAIATAGAAVRAAEAQVAQVRLALSYTEVKAPVAGWVTRKNVEAGDFIQTGQPVLNLVTDDLFVTANFKETQLAHLRPGQVATFTVDTYPGVTFAGRVDSRMAGTGSAFALLPPENATGNFVKVVQRIPVKITFDRAELDHLPKLALGMSVVATVDVSSTPATAVASNR